MDFQGLIYKIWETFIFLYIPNKEVLEEQVERVLSIYQEKLIKDTIS